MYIYNRQALKMAAKRDLKEFYWQGVLVCLINMAILWALGYTLNVLTFVISGPLSYGICSYFTNILRHKEGKVETLFEGFKRFGDTFILGLLRGVFIFLWSLLFVVPGIIKYISYSMCYFIQRDNPDMTAKECLEASKRLTDGHKGKMFMLAFSMLGWFILAGFIGGFIGAGMPILGGILASICAVFVYPYYFMAFARMYDYLILSYNDGKINSVEITSFDDEKSSEEPSDIFEI